MVNLKATESSQELADIAREIARTIKNIGEISSKSLELVVAGYDLLSKISELNTKTIESTALTRYSIDQVRRELAYVREKTGDIEADDPEQTTFVSRVIEELAIHLRMTVDLLKTNSDDTRKLYVKSVKEEKSLEIINRQLADSLRETIGNARETIREADALVEEATIYIDGAMEISRRITDASFYPDPRVRRHRLRFMFSSLEEKITLKIKSDKLTKTRTTSTKEKKDKIKPKEKLTPKQKATPKDKKSPKVKATPKVKASSKKYM